VKRKRYSQKFQRRAVERMETCEDVGELARELGVRPRCLYKWRKKLEMVEPGQEASRPSTHANSQLGLRHCGHWNTNKCRNGVALLSTDGPSEEHWLVINIFFFAALRDNADRHRVAIGYHFIANRVSP
jgi:transposase